MDRPGAGIVAEDGYPVERAHLIAAFDDQANAALARPETRSLLAALGAPATTYTQFTPLAWNEQWDALARQLRRDLPAVLRHVGLSAEPEPLVRHLVTRCQNELQGRHVSDLLPGWLEEFAAEHGQALSRALTPDDLRRIVVGGAAEDLLEPRLAQERTEWGRQLLDWLRQQVGALADGPRPLPVPAHLAEPHLAGRVRRYLDDFADDLAAESRTRLGAYGLQAAA